MRDLVPLAVMALAAQLSVAVASAQDAPSSDQRTAIYEPEDYASLRARVQQLESRQGLSGSSSSSQGGLYAQYDNVIVTPYLSENSAFPSQDNNGNISNYGFDFDLKYSPRVEVGYMAPTSELGFRARYWHFRTDSKVGPASDTNGLIANDAIGVAVGATVQDIDTITSIVYDLKVDVLDLEATRSVGTGTFAAGIRTAWIGQKYDLASDAGPLTTHLDVTGFGPTMAYEWKPRIAWVDGLSLLASVRGSLLYGGKDVDSVATDADYKYDEQSLIYNMDAQLGLEYRRDSGFFLRAALEAQYWANTGTATNQNVGRGDDAGDQEFVSSILDDDLGFLGMVFSAGYQW